MGPIDNKSVDDRTVDNFMQNTRDFGWKKEVVKEYPIHKQI